MTRILQITVFSLLVGFTAVALAEKAAEAGASKSGTIKSVDAKAKTFVLSIADKPELTFTLTDTTVITLDGKASTLDAAIKATLKATVTYQRGEGTLRTATEVAVTSAPDTK